MNKLGGALGLLLGLAAQGGWAAENMNFKGTLREDVPCVINGGQAINVNFETVGVNKIDGERYKQSFSVKVTCPAEFSVPYKLYYLGQSSGFDSAALATNVTGLGIKAQWKNKGVFTDVKPGAAISGNADLTLDFQVAPIRDKNVRLEPKPFNGNASFRLAYD